MADAPKKEHPKFRTFAQDFSTQQERRGTHQEPATEVVTQNKPEAVPMAKAPSDTIEQKPPFVHPVVKPVMPETTTLPEPLIEKIVEPIKAPAAISIPSFHDLQAEVAAIQLTNEDKPIEKKAPVEFTGKKPVPSSTPRMNIGFDSKVITDTKRKRFRLFPAIGASLSSWFKALFKPRKKQTPSYSVPEADRRKGVIQKATSKSGSVFSADSTELKEKIRQRQLREEDKKKAEALAQHEPETIWSPFTETGYDLLEEGEETPMVTAPKNVTIEYKQQQSLDVNRWHIDEPVPAVPATKLEPAAVVEPTPEIAVPQEVEASEPETPVIEELPKTEQLAESVPSLEPEPAFILEATSADYDESKKLTVNQQKFGVGRYTTNSLTLVALAVVTTIIVIVLVVRLFINTNQTITPVVYTDTTEPIAGAQLDSFVVTDNQSLLQQIKASQSVSEFGYVDTQVYTPNGEIIPPARVLELLQFTVLQSFSQSLTDVRFAYLNQSKPIIVFSYVDQATILGGFLTWEKNMFADLQLMYNLQGEQTNTFTDQTVGGIDVRVLLSETGQTLIVYGMVDENTALLSNSLADFTQVVETSF
jgi:hypothetical protein